MDEKMQEAGKTIEDYLEAILVLKHAQGYVRSVDLAAQLGITKPSVSHAVKRMKEKGYITTDHANMLILTESGRAIAEETYRRHRKLAEFFMQLGVGETQAQMDACKIEHDLSQETFDALCRYVDKTLRTPAEKQDGCGG